MPGSRPKRTGRKTDQEEARKKVSLAGGDGPVRACPREDVQGQELVVSWSVLCPYCGTLNKALLETSSYVYVLCGGCQEYFLA
ncbi:MAG: hypothetical protein KKA60_00505 [Proteobacteria bacterium]|nr:hypothetical protein [Pseudomonadota bacterium]